MVARLLESIDELADLERSITDLSYLPEAERKQALVKLRRTLVTILTLLLRDSATDHRLAGDAKLSEEFSRRLSALRSTVALHQAEWPAVTSDGNNTSYLESARHVTRSNLDFVAWAKTTFGQSGTR